MTSLTPTADRVIKIAKSQVGYHEGRSASGWNNHQKFSPAVPGLEWSQNQAWCATFVSWCALEARVVGLYPRTASTDTGAAWYKARGRWSEYPAIGAQGFLGSGNDMHHTFLVTGFDAHTITTVEGNSNTSGSAQGDGVYELRRPRRGPGSPVGYGYPKFPEGIVSADPRFAGESPERVRGERKRAKKKSRRPGLLKQAAARLEEWLGKKNRPHGRRKKVEAAYEALPTKVKEKKK